MHSTYVSEMPCIAQSQGVQIPCSNQVGIATNPALQLCEALSPLPTDAILAGLTPVAFNAQCAAIQAHDIMDTEVTQQVHAVSSEVCYGSHTLVVHTYAWSQHMRCPHIAASASL